MSNQECDHLLIAQGKGRTQKTEEKAFVQKTEDQWERPFALLRVILNKLQSTNNRELSPLTAQQQRSGRNQEEGSV